MPDPTEGFENGPGVENNRIVYFLDSNTKDSAATATLLQSLGLVPRQIAGGIAGLGQLSDREPGCLLVDADGIDAETIFGALPARRAALPVVVISAQAEISTIVELMRLGACDYLSKPLDRGSVAASLTRVFDRLRNETEAYQRRQCALARVADLTHREQDILRGLVAGGTNKMLAHDFGLSIRTVEMHRANLMTKLGLHSLAQAIRLAFEAGLDPVAMATPPTIRESAKSVTVDASTPA